MGFAFFPPFQGKAVKSPFVELLTLSFLEIS